MTLNLPAPPLPERLPAHAKWLAGEGAGSWFVIAPLPQASEFFSVERTDPTGHVECRGIFLCDATSTAFDVSLPFSITYPSHCAMVKVVQAGQVFTLVPIPAEIDLNR